MGDLIIGGTAFKIDAPVVNWYQSGWNATSEVCIPVQGHPESYGCTVAYGAKAKNRRPRRFSTRPRLRQFGLKPTYEATKNVINKFVLHHDGCFDAKMCWNVLHNERGLSAHFIIDNDGTIYQTLDLGLMGYHAKEFNPTSIGVEFCNRGDALEFPNYYEKRGVKGRDNRIKPCKINGHTIRSYDFTQKQYDNFLELARALTRLLPNIAVDFPQEPGSPGQQAWGTIDFGGAMGFSGYIGHYHLTNQKWDPGPFDIKEFCRKLRGQFCFPVFTKDPPKNEPSPRPYIPKQIDELRDISNQLYALNEQQADGGFFPVGPWGEQRLWHGGTHLTGKEGTPLFAPFPGRVMVARMGADGAVGSNNFVLLRHDLTLGDVPVKFWSLYMHLADELAPTPGTKPPEWLTKLKTPLKAGEVTILDEPVEASSPIGRMGSAGPEDLRRAQLHLEFFSLEPLFDRITGTPWELVDGTSGGRFCDADQITKLIDTDSDGKLSKQELSTFYRSGGGQQFRAMMTYHVSEWTFEPDWHDALRSKFADYDLKPAELDRMIDEQIVPGLWWNDEVAEHAGLPSGGEVVHYHPVKFVHWFNEKLLDAEIAAAPTAIDDNAAVKATAAGMTDDFGDVEGEHAMSDSEEDDDRCDKLIEKKDMVQGFDAPPKPGCP